MSIISASTTSTNAYKVTADTTGTLVLQTGSTPTTAVTIGTDQSVTTAGTINGLTVGRGAGAVSTNTAVGASALGANTTGGRNTALGNETLFSNTTGNNNLAVGGRDDAAWTPLYSNTTGSNNVAVGNAALSRNTTASNNTAVGYQAGFSNTTGTYSTLIGAQAGYSQTTGYGTYIGYQAGQFATTGQFNTFVGIQSGNLVTTGSKNTILGGFTGNQSGLDIRTSNNYIVLSDGDGNPRGYFNSSGNFLINNPASNYGMLTVSSACNTVKTGLTVANTDAGAGTFVGFINSAGNTAGSITQTGTTTVNYGTSSDYRLKTGIQPMTGALAKVAALKPCTYTWKDDGTAGEGFIAHELQEVAPQCVVGQKDAVDGEGKPVYQTIDTSFLVATLTAAIQELKAEFDAYKEAHP